MFEANAAAAEVQLKYNRGENVLVLISPGMSLCGEQERYFGVHTPLMAGKWKKQLYQMEKSLRGKVTAVGSSLIWEGA